MDSRAAITIICSDHTLLKNLDEPLQRASCHTELLPSIEAWDAQNSHRLSRLLIIDLKPLAESQVAPALSRLSASSRNLVAIPIDEASQAVSLPSGSILLSQRTPEALLQQIRTELGFPARLFHRSPFETDIEVHPQGAPPFPARCCDIGEGGTFIESSQQVTPGKRVTLRFSNSDFRCNGYVAWQRISGQGSLPRYGTGVQFLFPDRQRLAKLLKDAHPDTTQPTR